MLKRLLPLTLLTTAIAATTTPAIALPYCYSLDSSGNVINLEDLCRVSTPAPPPTQTATAPTPPPVPAPGGGPGVAPVQVIAPPMVDLASTRVMNGGAQTRASVLVRFDRSAPEGQTATVVVTGDGQTVTRTVSRVDGRSQTVDLFLRGKVGNSQISARLQ